MKYMEYVKSRLILEASYIENSILSANPEPMGMRHIVCDLKAKDALRNLDILNRENPKHRMKMHYEMGENHKRRIAA